MTGWSLPEPGSTQEAWAYGVLWRVARFNIDGDRPTRTKVNANHTWLVDMLVSAGLLRNDSMNRKRWALALTPDGQKWMREAADRVERRPGATKDMLEHIENGHGGGLCYACDAALLLPPPA